MGNKELYNAAEQYGKGSEYPQQLENAFVAGAEWEQGRDKWISVDNSLPQHYEWVLISDGNVVTIGWNTPVGWDGYKKMYQEMQPIVKWQPIPKP